MMENYGTLHSIDVGTASFDSSEELLSAIAGGMLYDIYVLDIYMTGESGISLASRLRARDDICAIIFLTHSRDHALEAFQVNAAHYLLKPVEQAEFFAALDRCRSELSLRRDTEETRAIIVQGADAMESVPQNEILYIESLGKHQKITLPHQNVVTKTTLQSLAGELLPTGMFFMPHRAYIVNVKHVRKITQDRVVMKNGEDIPIARRKCQEVKAFFLDYSFDDPSAPRK